MPMILDVAPRVIEVDCRGLAEDGLPCSHFAECTPKVTDGSPDTQS